jgi:hypothetical protein
MKKAAQSSLFIYVRMKGLEPPRLTTPDPKSGAATNYATSAATLAGRKGTIISGSAKLLTQII